MTWKEIAPTVRLVEGIYEKRVNAVAKGLESQEISAPNSAA
jgi:hypothetical protein